MNDIRATGKIIVTACVAFHDLGSKIDVFSKYDEWENDVVVCLEMFEIFY